MSYYNDEYDGRPNPPETPGYPGSGYPGGGYPGGGYPGGGYPPPGGGYQGGGYPPPGGGYQGGGGGPYPTSPPPSFVPQQSQGYSAAAVAPSSLRMCLYRWTYVWLDNGQQFWIWPFMVRQRTVSYYRYSPYYGYLLGATDTRRIDSFVCGY